MTYSSSVSEAERSDDSSVGHHSTSDDSTIYRDDAEIEKYQQLDPIRSLKSYLKQHKLWDESQNELFIKATNKKIMEAIKVAENDSLPGQDDIFNNVYSAIPFHISKQQVGLQKYFKRRNQLVNGK
uniref:2-oxoisovalerate dehydrogenase subunit alpha n=1 Tax=Trichogramma kaykai TaxID=54128 RepID=A0ABD2WZG4_9HYME